MIYHCENCGFLFARFGAVQTCPACEKTGIRLATPEEEKCFRRQLHGENAAPERGNA